jgi:hypothetical protein
MLGGSADDPLIRMLARGVAGYRTAAKALQYSLPGAFVTIESISDADASGTALVSFRVEGQLRDGHPFTGRASLRLVCAEGELASINVVCAEDDLARIAASRRA